MKYDGHLLLTAHPCANYAQPHSVCPTPVPPLGRATFPVELRCLRPAVSKHSLPGECSRHSDDEGWWRNLDRIKKLLFSSKTYKIGYAPRLPILFNGYLKLLSYPKNLNGRGVKLLLTSICAEVWISGSVPTLPDKLSCRAQKYLYPYFAFTSQRQVTHRKPRLQNSWRVTLTNCSSHVSEHYNYGICNDAWTSFKAVTSVHGQADILNSTPTYQTQELARKIL